MKMGDWGEVQIELKMFYWMKMVTIPRPTTNASSHHIYVVSLSKRKGIEGERQLPSQNTTTHFNSNANFKPHTSFSL